VKRGAGFFWGSVRVGGLHFFSQGPSAKRGITFAGEFYTGNAKHFFLYFQSVKLIIDFTERKRYLLQDSLSFKY